ncbi:glutamate-5-semialdehyde dehydrogenase [Candidatus Micrarchaeota archaeon]|nr:glutamate-5-semialdehyde dehydrogenase [Candidatus Micrarchaeota archaeon]
MILFRAVDAFPQNPRQSPDSTNCQRVVVKFGTQVLTTDSGSLDLNALRDLVSVIAGHRLKGTHVAIVTSGAIGAGASAIGLKRQGLSVAQQQVAAAVGQSLLMEQYNALFGRKGIAVAQLLLTNDDFEDEKRRKNLVGTLHALLQQGIVPVINENDVVTTSELDFSSGKTGGAFGDNDELSSLVAQAIGAQTLVLMSNVDGLLGPNGHVIPEVADVSDSLESLDLKNGNGRGGLKTKLKAARFATRAGIGVYWINRHATTLEHVLEGQTAGTKFAPAGTATNEVEQQVRNAVQQSRQARHDLARTLATQRNDALQKMSDALDVHRQRILEANAKDVQKARDDGRPEAFIERLALDGVKLDALQRTLVDVETLVLPDMRMREWTLPNQVVIRQVRVPIGVVALVFEARPDVVVEAAALCIKTGNALLLKGSRQAHATNTAIVRSLQDALQATGLPNGCVQLLPPERESTDALLKNTCVDLVIPRGGADLVTKVRKDALMPVIFAGGGTCHVYVHRDADLDMATGILLNAKTQKPSACNACETLLIHRDIAAQALPRLAAALQNAGVTVKGDAACLKILVGDVIQSQREPDWRAEYLNLTLAVRVVERLEQAVDHINRYGTHHSDAIITADERSARQFMDEVDSAAVYWNASTRFTDGGQFGFGAELGISTQKTHVRGPIGIDALYTYHYEITGNGQVRT